MNKPQSVNTAILTIWGTLAASVLVAVIDKNIGGATHEDFMQSLFSTLLICLLPYKMSLGENWSRYLFGLAVALSLAMLLAGATPGLSKIVIAATWVLLPIHGWAVYLLFQPESSAWFEAKSA